MLKSKDDSLKYNNENFNAKMKLTNEVDWWKRNVFTVFKPIRNHRITKAIYTED